MDKEISQYLGKLNTKQKQVVLTVVKTFADDGDYDHWDDPSFIAELDRRTAEYESGKVKGHTLNEVEAGARKAYKAKQRNKNEL